MKSPALLPTAALTGSVAVFMTVSLLFSDRVLANGATSVAHGLALQAARAKFVRLKAKKVFYTRRWNLDRLPTYHPRHQVHGTLRIWGSNYITDSNLGNYWVAGFHKYEPGVRFTFHMKTALAAVPALVFGVADIGVGHKITFSEQLLYERYKNRDPLTISVATGSYNVTGWQPGYGILVNRDNPINCLTIEQLDGIFGSQRSGGWHGTSWHPEYARGPEQNVRVWGQLGLTGKWAHHVIDPYGLNLRYHQTQEMSDLILKGSDKWNGALRIYANYVTRKGALGRNLKSDLAKDRYGIGWVAAPTYHRPPQLKVLAIARHEGGRCIRYTINTVRDRTYPLYSQVYMFANRRRSGAINPVVRQFLRYVVSRQGQEAIERDGKYLPLTAKVAWAQWRKLR